MTIGTLALLVAVGLLGPALSWSDGLRVPVVVGELLAGVLVGDTGLHLVDPRTPTVTFLADVGFALVMFLAGTHVPVRAPALRSGLRVGLLRAACVGAASAGLGPLVAALFGTGHGALYAVLFASSSAAIILPVVDSLQLGGPHVLALLPQVAIADAACIVALPLAIQPAKAASAAGGALVVLAAVGAVFLLLRLSERRGWRSALHRKSEERNLALELRTSLLLLVLLAGLAQRVGVSILLAGFATGLAVAAVGEPRRLARQLFGLTEGLFGPLFFVWLGASLDLRALTADPALIVLAAALAAAAILTHAAAALTRQPVALAVLASAQLGVPIAAATLASQQGLLRPGEPAALLLAALLTVAAASIAARITAAHATPAAPPVA